MKNYQDIYHFNNVLPEFLSPFLACSITFDTQVQESCNGRENRRLNRYIPINKYRILSCILPYKEFTELVNFFCIHKGRSFSFLLTDYSNFLASHQPLVEVSQNEVEVEEGQKYDIGQYKPYFLVQSYANQQKYESISLTDLSELSFDQKTYRVIKFPKLDSIELLNNKTNKKITDFYYDRQNGILMLKKNYDASDVLASFSFFTSVRFEDDCLSYKADINDCIYLEDIRMREVIL